MRRDRRPGPLDGLGARYRIRQQSRGGSEPSFGIAPTPPTQTRQLPPRAVLGGLFIEDHSGRGPFFYILSLASCALVLHALSATCSQLFQDVGALGELRTKRKYTRGGHKKLKLVAPVLESYLHEMQNTSEKERQRFYAKIVALPQLVAAEVNFLDTNSSQTGLPTNYLHGLFLVCSDTRTTLTFVCRLVCARARACLFIKMPR